MRKASLARVFVLFACLTVFVAGCSGDDESEPESSSGDSDSASSSTPPPPPPRPKADRCYDLGKSAVSSASNDADPVACKGRHTTQTYLVGTLPKKLTNVDTLDAAAIADTVSKRCDDAFNGHVGGDDETRTLARVHPVWFVPTEDEIARGARWFRCDVTATKAGGTVAALPAKSKGMLDSDDALDQWGTCAPADAERPEAEAMLCSEPHGMAAISVVNLGDADADWPGSEELAGKGQAECEADVRDYTDNSTGALEFRWSYPTRQQWKDGRRYGLCWSSDGP